MRSARIMHTLFFPDLSSAGETLLIEGEEARHAARVKRMGVGEALRLLDGRGLVAEGRVVEAGMSLRVRVEGRRVVAPVRPRVEVWSATPKGGRVDGMIDALAQVGAASWTPLATARGVVEPREAKLKRLERIVVEACKQANRPWLMTIESSEGARSFEEAIGRDGGEGAELVVADGGGESDRGGYVREEGVGAVRLLIGPEGGFTAEELGAARGAGARFVSLGPHTMRVEVAAAVGVAIILAAHESR